MTLAAGNEVIYCDEPSPVIGSDMLIRLKSAATRAKAGRARICLHGDHADPVQTMLIAHSIRSLDRPHRLLNRSVSILVLEGRLLLVVFDDTGRSIEHTELVAFGKKKPFLARLSQGEWFSCVPLTDPVVIFETIPGPFMKEPGFYPDWAPEGGEELRQFLTAAIKNQLEQDR